MADELNHKQKRFCEEYIKHLNASAAYMAAGYSAKNGDVAAAAASRLLSNVKVQAYLSELMAQRRNDRGISIDRVLNEYARIAFSDITQVVDFDANGAVLRDSKKLPKDVSAAISSISCSTTEGKDGLTVKSSIRMYDKTKALDALAKYLGLLSDLNQAKATFRAYGYKLQETDRGYELIDTYADEGKGGSEDEGGEIS